ncbi:MAG: PqqD family protein [Oscillospiraceae bacterium]|nr:PqqD family protein [Oscillospiraceae bacterium]
MRVKDNFIFRRIADEHLLIPTGEAAMHVKGLIALSESGSLLYQKLRNECSRADLVAALMAEYDVTEAVAGEDVDAFLDQMRQLDMLVEE